MAEDWVLKGSLKGPQGEPGETPDLSAYATTESLTQAVAAESSAREKADELLQADVDGKLAPDDVVAGENVSVQVGETGTVTISAEPGLPEGGTEGQVLTKTADGEAWQDAPEADMDYYLKLSHVATRTVMSASYDGQSGFLDGFSLVPYDTNPDSGALAKEINFKVLAPSIVIKGDNGNLSFTSSNGKFISGIGVVNQTTPQFMLSEKSVTSITDAISDTDSNRANELVTGKAVADYVAENAGSGLPEGGSTRDVLVKTASGEEWSGGYVWVDSENSDYTLRGYFADGERNIPILNITSNGIGSSIELNGTSGITVANNSTATIEVKSATFGEYARLTTSADNYAEIATNGRLTIGSKSVSSITDDASDGSSSALVTAKAVKDYVAALIATDEEFDAAFGL